MDKNKKLSIFSTILAIILSDLMSANVAIVYCNKLKYEIPSASARDAFLVAIPYIIIILSTLINSYILWKKSGRN
ncbi:MAG: hypothetical protein K0Q49_2599 [Haloplasmataceae bacterium]|jgi:hypothetical protein|nr:hypothetical protein [Haloplasmataceae bacterium]